MSGLFPRFNRSRRPQEASAGVSKMQPYVDADQVTHVPPAVLPYGHVTVVLREDHPWFDAIYQNVTDHGRNNEFGFEFGFEFIPRVEFESTITFGDVHHTCWWRMTSSPMLQRSDFLPTANRQLRDHWHMTCEFEVSVEPGDPIAAVYHVLTRDQPEDQS